MAQGQRASGAAKRTGARAGSSRAASRPDPDPVEPDAPIGDGPPPEVEPDPAALPVEDPPREAELVASGEEPAEEDPDAPRVYRTRQGIYGPSGYVAPGGLVILRPSSGYASSIYTELVEDGEQIPASVAAALAAAQG